MGKVLLILIISLFIRPAFSCSCLEIGKLNDEQYNSYELILMGEVFYIDDSLEFENVFHVKINSLYKGHFSFDTIKIFTPKSSGSCGLFTMVGFNWIFYLTNYSNKYEVSDCSPSKIVVHKSPNNYRKEIKEDLVFLIKKLILKKFLFID